MRIEVSLCQDEAGELEQFTWDLFPVVDSCKTLHLEENGLPKVGTSIRPGMILVGKIAKTKKFDPAKQPTSLEIHGLEFEELRDKFAAMWKDASLYADDATSGFVRQAYLEESPSGLRAVVEIEPAVLSKERPTAGAASNRG